MFKSIEYKLYFYMVLLVAAVVSTTYFAIRAEYVFMALSVFVVFILLHWLRRSYNQFNKNIIFLLNALDNGDYSFNFAETKLSRREKELNQMMNRIKEILSKARIEVIENEKFLGVVMESVSTGIIILGEENRVVQVNRIVHSLLGLQVFTHVNQLAAIDKSFPDLFRNLEPSDSKTIQITNEREVVQLSLQASEIVLRGKKLKIITLNNIGSELDYKEMDSWIRLIRVMTHEIMNSIAPVTSLTDTLLSAFRQDNQDAEMDALTQDTIEALQTINTTAKGLIGFVNSYRRFTGIPQPQLKPVSLQSLIERAVVLENSLFEEKGIRVTMQLPPAPVVVQLDESQVMQVMLNLLKNAGEAGSLEVGSLEAGSGKSRSEEVGSEEVGSEEVGSEEVGSEEVGSEEVGSEEVEKSEVGSYGEPRTKNQESRLKIESEIDKKIEGIGGEIDSGGVKEIRIELSQERGKIHLDVCDNGLPIAEDVLPHIFIPFFTTKQSGTGIGLSVSRYIMRLHDGTLTHFTKKEWTVFRMTFNHSGK